MHRVVLIAGVVLIVSGRTDPVAASGFTSPFLVIFEGVKGRCRHEAGTCGVVTELPSPPLSAQCPSRLVVNI